jgi:hypothetical protein
MPSCPDVAGGRPVLESGFHERLQRNEAGRASQVAGCSVS